MHALGDAIDLALRQPQSLADVADGAGVAVFDEVTDHGRVLCRVLLEDVTEHLVARLSPEIKVDVRHIRQRPVRTEKALHRKVVFHRVDAGEAEEKTHHRANG